MAFIGEDPCQPLWLPHPLPKDILTGSTVVLLGEELPQQARTVGPSGFVCRNWFGPFLLGPTLLLLRGRC